MKYALFSVPVGTIYDLPQPIKEGETGPVSTIGDEGLYGQACQVRTAPGGVTAADIVIHYDPWWNVAAQNQATDRAYRIGQQNPVQVYKLIAQDTIEEKIVELQQAKQSLADTVTGTADGAILSMRPDELLQLLEGSEP